jgi:hypothetical protein
MSDCHLWCVGFSVPNGYETSCRSLVDAEFGDFVVFVFESRQSANDWGSADS